MKDKTNSKNKILTVIISVMFLAFIFAGCLLYVFTPKSDYSELEKRYLSTAPEISLKKVKSGEFSSDFEKFLADQTPLRSFFVSVNAYFELIKGGNSVYLCKNGWLIEKPFETENRFDKNLKEITDFAEKCDLPVTLIAVPEKGALLGAYLPKNALEYHDFDYMQKIADAFAKIDNAEYVDLREPFSDMLNRSYYYRTDHHWTSEGAFAAYRELCAVKGFSEPALTDYDISSFDGFYGTSYSTSCYFLTKPDEVHLFINPNLNAKVKITEGSDVRENDSVFFTDRLDEGDMYTVFLDGNHTRVDITSGVNDKKLLLIKDSFAHCLAPFLAEQYGEITMIDQRYFNTPVSRLIEEEGFDELMFVYGVSGLATDRDISLF